MPSIPKKSKEKGDGENNSAPALSEARWLYDRELWVVPCNGKVAIWKDWPTVRRSKEELETKLASDPKLNIAIVLNQSEWIDVECDSSEIEARLQAMFGGKVPRTPTWKSKRGPHRLFRRPPGLPEKAKLEIDGVEFHIGNGKGALSIVPPSVHPDGPQYEWLPKLSLREVEPAELPPAIADRLRAADAPTNSEPATEGDISEGKRNDTLFVRACALRELKLPDETILTTLLDLNRRQCKPPLPEQEVRAIALSASKTEGKAGGFLAQLLGEVELWHDENSEPFLTLTQNGHRENWPIGSRVKAFRRWLSKKFYEAAKTTLPASDLAEMAALLEGKAVFDGPQYELFRRTAKHEDNFYLDLCDDSWRAVEISAKGWKVVSDPPVKFRRAKAMFALPEPVKTEAKFLKKLLWPYLNAKETQWPLIAAWLAAAIRPRGPYPIMKLLGEQGAAKTTTARVLRALIDPNAAPVRSEPRDTRDMMIAANNGWILCLDNLSHVKQDLSDALCRMATGGGFATRTLYSDDDETIFDAQRPVILTSIEEIGTRSDLLERSLIIELPTIAEGKRRAEKAFWKEFEEVRPKILGALLDVVCGAIRKLPEIEGKTDTNLSRMADFEQWGEAAESVLGLKPGVFAEAYAANREAATQVALEASPVIAALLKYVEGQAKKNKAIEMTAKDLLVDLALASPELAKSPKWPKAPNWLSQILRRLAPDLRAIGIEAVQDTRGGGERKEKVWRIERTEKKEGEPIAPSAPIGPPKRETLSDSFTRIGTGLIGSIGSKGSMNNGQSFSKKRGDNAENALRS